MKYFASGLLALLLAAIAVLQQQRVFTPEGLYSGISFWPPGKSAPKVRILSWTPVVAHIENFLSAWECQQLIRLAEPLLQQSQVLFPNGSSLVYRSDRSSATAFLPSDNHIVARIKDRASEFQGYIISNRSEVQVTWYEPGQRYGAHYDWHRNRTQNRFSTFFAILEANCVNCGTQFPYLLMDWEREDPRWCEFFNCSQQALTSLNNVGHALFWNNLDENFQGRPEVLHEGLPVTSGRKIGLNIWTVVDTDSS
ncbi:hypothetical protein BST61_g6831 [Cercospora zeina]